ncbi:MAG: hypothetical protein RR747_03120 [Gordonibacter sp.]
MAPCARPSASNTNQAVEGMGRCGVGNRQEMFDLLLQSADAEED